MRSHVVFVVLSSVALVPVTTRPAWAQVPSLEDILTLSPESDWRSIDPENALYVELPGGRVIIELSPDFSPQHVANVRALARADFWENAAVVRVQDNYVTQWGVPDGDIRDRGAAVAEITAAEFDRATGDLPFTPLPDPDAYAVATGFTHGLPVGRDGQGRTWMLHCYGVVGVARGNPPDSGDGSALYVVIGQSPRHLDRNVAMIGRVVQGVDLLSSLPRGTGSLGFYETPAERLPIRSIRLAADVPPGERTELEVLRTDTPTFQAVIESRRFRRESWFVQPAGRINVCNVPLPVRAGAR